jgi:hypothetical protein
MRLAGTLITSPPQTCRFNIPLKKHWNDSIFKLTGLVTPCRVSADDFDGDVAVEPEHRPLVDAG